MATGDTAKPPRWASILGVFVFLGGIGGLLYGLYWLFTTAKPELIAAVVAAVGTMLVTLISIVVTRHFERKARYEEDIRLKKVPIYESWFDFFFRTLLASKTGDPKPTEIETMKFIADFTKNSMIWASDDVLQAFVSWRKSAVRMESEGGVESLFAMERLLLAIRRDLGHSNKGINRGDLLSLFISDLP